MADSDFGEYFLAANLRELLFHLIFMAVIISIALWRMKGSSYYEAQPIVKFFLENDFMGSSCCVNFFTIKSIPEVWEFLFHFSEILAIKNVLNINIGRAADKFHLGKAEIYLVDIPVIRQLRIQKEETCFSPDPTSDKLIGCYKFFNYSTASFKPFGGQKSSFQPFGQKSSFHPFGQSSSPWIYKPNERCPKMISGEISYYESGGYYANVVWDHTSTVNNLKYLKANNWIDEATRAVIIEFTTYGPISNAFEVCRLLMELTPTAGVITSVDMRSVKFFTIRSSSDYFFLFLIVLAVIMTFFLIFERLREFRYFGSCFLCKCWEIMEWAIITMAILAAVSISLKYRTIVNYTERDANPKQGKPNIPCFFNFIGFQKMFDFSMAILVFLLCLKLLKFLAIFENIYYLLSTIFKFCQIISNFAILQFLLLCAFSLGSYLLFGQDVYEFSRYRKAFLSNMLIVIGMFPYQKLINLYPVLGPIYLYIIKIVFTMILLSTLIASIVYAYFCTKEAGSNNIFFCDALYYYFKKSDECDCPDEKPSNEEDNCKCDPCFPTVAIRTLTTEINSPFYSNQSSPFESLNEERNYFFRLKSVDKSVESFIRKMNGPIKKVESSNDCSRSGYNFE